MSQGGDLFALGEGVASQPSFDDALRGYKKNQVNDYVAQAEAEIATLAAEREQAYQQVQALAGQVQLLQDDLAETRRRSQLPAKTSFKHLGPRVEQILALAEEQAEAIIHDAHRQAADDRREAERQLADARDRAAAAIRDFETALSARRSDEQRADEERRTASARSLGSAQQEAANL
ncbi:MAG: hypothetical protein HOV79_19990, partial [Hamadaea sp.]|nr:hypothetical protein [Hamadaea sp.]